MRILNIIRGFFEAIREHREKMIAKWKFRHYVKQLEKAANHYYKYVH